MLAANMSLLKIPILVPSVWLFNISFMSPNSPPDESERVYGTFYEHICPALFPVLHRLSASIPCVAESAVLLATNYPLQILLRGALSIGALWPTTHLQRQLLLLSRICPRRHRWHGTSLVFPRSGAALYPSARCSKRPQTHYHGALCDRPTSRVFVWDVKRARHVPHHRQPRLVHALLWLARDGVWENNHWHLGNAKCVGMGAQLRAMSTRRYALADALWKRSGTFIPKGSDTA
ncbi:hypothetical protein JVU11DRAFT_11611 [Chiua virens]|nr:hypothetical protein JVU11DRAFT_11611 [Chiua virens]